MRHMECKDCDLGGKQIDTRLNSQSDLEFVTFPKADDRSSVVIGRSFLVGDGWVYTFIIWKLCM